MKDTDNFPSLTSFSLSCNACTQMTFPSKRIVRIQVKSIRARPSHAHTNFDESWMTNLNEKSILDESMTIAPFSLINSHNS